MDSKKKSFLQKQKETYRDFWSQYLSLKGELETCGALKKEETVPRLEKLRNCLACFRWKIWHFEHSEESIGRQIKKSFQDLRTEIDWRMEEVSLAFTGKDICDEDEERRLEKIYSIEK